MTGAENRGERTLASRLVVAGIDAWVASEAADLDAFERAVLFGRPEGSPRVGGAATTADVANAARTCAARALARAGLADGSKVRCVLVGEATDPGTPAEHAKSVFDALERAAASLASGEAEAVVVLEARRADVANRPDGAARKESGGCSLGIARAAVAPPSRDGAAAIILVREARATAVCAIEAAAEVVASPDADTVSWAAQLALGEAHVTPADVGYLEMALRGGTHGEGAEIEGLALAYRSAAHTVAVGCHVSAVGETGLALLSLVKAALAVRGRTLPGTAMWSGPRAPEAWQGSPFYVPDALRPWFTRAGQQHRVAGVSLVEGSSVAHVVVAEAREHDAPSVAMPARAPLSPTRLFTIDARTPDDLVRAVERVSAEFAHGRAEPPPADSDATLTLVLVGATDADLAAEAALARRGVPEALATGNDWQTPRGSQFAPRPLGRRGKVAFVYPGALSAYPGVARDLFRAFPCIWEAAAARGVPLADVLADRTLYARSLEPLGGGAQADFHADLPTLIHAGIACGAVFTWALVQGLGIVPDIALGYSLGECTMLWALDVWSEAGSGLEALTKDPLFTEELGGPQRAVRTYWARAGAPSPPGEAAWGQVVVLASKERVLRALEEESHVFLLAVNSPKELVLGGHPQACRRFVEREKLEAVWMPGEVALHCDVIASKRKELRRFCTREAHDVPKTTFYVGDNPCAPTAPDLPDRLTAGLVRAIDFPRSIERAYEAGARIFVECGPGATSSRWVGEILKGREHVVVAFDRRGVSAETSALRLEARLRAHRLRFADSR